MAHKTEQEWLAGKRIELDLEHSTHSHSVRGTNDIFLPDAAVADIMVVGSTCDLCVRAL